MIFSFLEVLVVYSWYNFGITAVKDVILLKFIWKYVGFEILEIHVSPVVAVKTNGPKTDYLEYAPDNVLQSVYGYNMFYLIFAEKTSSATFVRSRHSEWAQ